MRFKYEEPQTIAYQVRQFCESLWEGGGGLLVIFMNSNIITLSSSGRTNIPQALTNVHVTIFASVFLLLNIILFLLLLFDFIHKFNRFGFHFPAQNSINSQPPSVQISLS